MELRPYQVDAISNLRLAIAQGKRSPVLVMPTGSGKTLVAKAMIESAIAKGRSVLFLAPRRELIFQTCEKLEQAGIYHGVIMSGERPRLMTGVQVACVPTLHRRLADKRIFLPAADLVLIDEAHLAISRTTREVLDAYPQAVKVGLTATPCRGDGQGLGVVFDDLVLGPTITELTAQGYLVPARYFAGRERPDLKGVKLQAGDYSAGELGERMDRKELVGDVVSNWLRLASDRKTVVFAVNIAHSLHLRECFESAGVRTAHLDCNTPTEERRGILRDLREGSLQVLVNVDVMTYGVDVPAISCAVLARPTKSLVRYMQSIGRVLRPYPGQQDVLVLDHGCCVDDLGFVDDPVEWSLDGKAGKEKVAVRKERQEAAEMTCKACGNIYRPAPACPNCGAQSARKAKPVEVIDADLTELDRNKRRQNREWTREQKEQFYAELLGYSKQKRYAQGWAAHKYRAKFGVWPNAHSGTGPREPGAEALAWIRHIQIRYAKGSQRGAKQGATACA